jgi:hypothetical protein
MGRGSASEFDRKSTMLWCRYLRKSLDCIVPDLNQSLLLPVTDHRTLLPGGAPPYFDKVYKLGKNPNGMYWDELDGSGRKFNLFERACERVPASRKWLLSEFQRYLHEDPPPVAISRQHLRTFLVERQLMFLPRRVASALHHLRPELYLWLQERATLDLVMAATPCTVLLLIAYLHELTWSNKGRSIEPVVGIAENAIEAFSDSLTGRQFDDAPEIGDVIASSLREAVWSIKRWGDRSPPSSRPRELEGLPCIPLLIADTPEMRDACHCLHAAGEENWECTYQPLPARYEGLDDPEVYWIPTTRAVRLATSDVVRGVLSCHKVISTEYERTLLCAPPAQPIAAEESGISSRKLRRRRIQLRMIGARR